LRWEFPAIGLAAWACFVSIPLCLGQIGISWDALNHQIYLGWIADHPRFDRDFLAASYQAFQYPYLYWPLYKLSASGLSGAAAGAVLATLDWLAVPAVWMIARTCMPGRQWFDVTMRALGVGLAFVTGLVLSLFDSTSNDFLAAVPFVWALAFALSSAAGPRSLLLSSRNAVICSGLLAGVAVAGKLSNGPLALLLPGLWLLSASGTRERVANVVLGGVATVIAFVGAYGFWGWELWLHVGNPIYPFADDWFAPLRAWLGWRP
jgi:hypothetical protein